MWYFSTPLVVFGDDALSHLETLPARRVMIVTDAFLADSAMFRQVRARLEAARVPVSVFADVQPEPDLETVRRCAAALTAAQPDWIIGLGGGSVLDAAKAAWALYERPDIDPAGISPMETFGLRARARLITIPTTSGTGSEATWAAVLTDAQEKRKLSVATRELLADVAIVDPALAMTLPPSLTVLTGLDALTHAIEAFSSAWANDFADGPSLKAAQLIFTYLPRVAADGADAEAREKMHNAATLAGIALSNSQVALAHALGHSVGALFGLPHGRAVSVALPYTLEYNINAGVGRYLDLARFIGLAVTSEAEAGPALAEAFRELLRRLGQPLSYAGCGVPRDAFQAELEALCDRADLDANLVASRRLPDRAEMRRLFECAYEGKNVDF